MRGYKNFIKNYGGAIVGYLHNNIVLMDGQLHNTIIFEILKSDYHKEGKKCEYPQFLKKM